MIKVIFCRKHNLGSLFLRTVLWSAWSHCAIVDGDHVIEATFPHGVVRRPLAEFQQEASKWEILYFHAYSERNVIQAARDQLGKPYDLLGVLGIGFKRKWQNDGAWFCSELVAGAFALAGEPKFRVNAWRITPRDLYIPI